MSIVADVARAMKKANVSEECTKIVKSVMSTVPNDHWSGRCKKMFTPQTESSTSVFVITSHDTQAANLSSSGRRSASCCLS